MKRFKGFTLSELMIALAVIGIIVAIVTPAITRTRPNKNKMMIKKSYYTAENIISALINDERLYPDKTGDCYLDGEQVGADCRWGFDDTSEVNYEGTNYIGITKFCGLFKARLNVKSEAADNTCNFTTSDGINWNLSDTVNAWDAPKAGVGTFDAQNGNTPGLGSMTINVEPSATAVPCVDDSEDCNQYTIQILANGKMRVNPAHSVAARYIEVGTTLRD